MLKKVDQSKFAAIKEKYLINGEYLFYSANTWPHKNHIGLLRALKKLRENYGMNISLICTGYKYDEYFHELQAIIDELRLADAVTFTGYVSEDDLLLLLSNAHIW